MIADAGPFRCGSDAASAPLQPCLRCATGCRHRRPRPRSRTRIGARGVQRARRRLAGEVGVDAIEHRARRALRWCAGSVRRRSSSGLEMKAVSTSIAGMSEVRSTAKLARSMCGLWLLPTRLRPSRTCPAASSDAFMCPLWVRSSSTEARVLLVCSRRTPPIRSEAFSLSASQRARCEDAPLSDSTYTDEPLALRFSAASAWIETNMSALAWRASCARRGSGMNTSVSRVR